MNIIEFRWLDFHINSFTKNPLSFKRLLVSKVVMTARSSRSKSRSDSRIFSNGDRISSGPSTMTFPVISCKVSWEETRSVDSDKSSGEKGTPGISR